MIIGLIPAAGASHRMGRPKLLLPWGTGSVLDQILKTLEDSRVDHTLLIAPPADVEGIDEILSAFRDIAQRWRAHVVNLPHPTADMLGTLRIGIRAAANRWGLDPQSDGLLIMPADIPTMSVAVVNQLIDHHAAGAGPILVPTYGGRRGHPLLVSASLVDEISSLPAGVGLDELIRQHADRVVECAVERPEILDDMDTPDDYRRLREGGSPGT